MECLWQIFVPDVGNDGIQFPLSHHQEWDRVVHRIAGGLTIMRCAVGQWQNKGTLYRERMIPVHIICTESDISKIMEFTARHYSQKEVVACKLSEYVKRLKNGS